MSPALRQLLDDYAAAGVYARWALEDDGGPVVAFYFRNPDGSECEWPHIATALDMLPLELWRWCRLRERKGHPTVAPMRAALGRYQMTETPPPQVPWGSP